MDNLPYQTVAKICSFTDDDSIFSLVCTCKSYCTLMNIAKNEICFQRKHQIAYGLNILRDAIPEFSIVPYDVYNFDNVNVVNKYIGENIETVQHKHYVSSPSSEKLFTTYCFNIELLRNDILTSVKIKGKVHNIYFQFHSSHTFYDNMNEGFWSILQTDEQGYKEVLSCFMPYIYFRIFPSSFIVLKIRHTGDIDIRSTFVNFDDYHKSIIENITFRQSDVVFTHAIIPEMLKKNLPFDNNKKSLSFEVYPSFISKGFLFVLRSDGKSIDLPSKIVKLVEIELYQNSIPSNVTKRFTFDSRSISMNRIKKSMFYNLKFDFNDNCLYIPLNNVNFRYVHKTVIRVTFHDDINVIGLLDVIYLSDNMIVNKHGFGSRYYW